jgi:hypothetical protein
MPNIRQYGDIHCTANIAEGRSDDSGPSSIPPKFNCSPPAGPASGFGFGFTVSCAFHQDELKLNLRSFPPIERSHVPLKISSGSRKREGCAAR